MTFIDQRLPTGIERGAKRVDENDVEIVQTDGGHEVRNSRWSQSLREFHVSFADERLNSRVNIAAIRNMFAVTRGALNPFRFRDWTEYQLTDELIATGDGAETDFQIIKSTTVAGETVSRNITRPCSDPVPVVKVNGSVVGGYTIDYDTGIITFSVAPTNTHPITITCEFDLPVRFDLSLSSALANFNAERIDDLTLIEVKE